MNRKRDPDHRTVGADRAPSTSGSAQSASSSAEPETTLSEREEGVQADGLRFVLRPPIDFEMTFRSFAYTILMPYARTEAKVSIGGAPARQWTWASGSALLISPDQGVFVNMAEPVELLMVMVNPDRAEAVFNRVARGRRWNTQPLESLADPGIAALQQEVRRSLLGDPLAEPAYLEALADSMLARIGCWLSGLAIGSRTREVIAPHVLRRIIQRVESGLDEKLVVADLAHEAGLSRSHFTRAFRAATGESPREFIISRRLCRARDLLSGSDRRIAEIALEAGFSSQAHLSATFKKRIGVSPGQYRAAFRGDQAVIDDLDED